MRASRSCARRLADRPMPTRHARCAVQITAFDLMCQHAWLWLQRHLQPPFMTSRTPSAGCRVNCSSHSRALGQERPTARCGMRSLLAIHQPMNLRCSHHIICFCQFTLVVASLHNQLRQVTRSAWVRNRKSSLFVMRNCQFTNLEPWIAFCKRENPSDGSIISMQLERLPP